MKEKLDCIVKQFTPKLKVRGWKQHYGAAAKIGDEFFVSPSIIGMNDVEAVLCLSYDSVTMVNYKNHALAPVSWLRENGKTLDALNAFEKWLKVHWDDCEN